MATLGQDFDDDGSPRAALALAVEALAAFNDRSGQRLRIDSEGWTWTNETDVFRSLGELSDLVELLPLAVRHLVRAMLVVPEADAVAAESGGRRPGRAHEAAIADACAALSPVPLTTESLHAALTEARRSIGAVRYADI